MTGAELITQERNDQINKHNRTVESDVASNDHGQLLQAVSILLHAPESVVEQARQGNVDGLAPEGWDKVVFAKMLSKEWKDRLIVAGALLAAEYDRLTALENA